MQDSILCAEYVMHAMWECGVCVCGVVELLEDK